MPYLLIILLNGDPNTDLPITNYFVSRKSVMNRNRLCSFMTNMMKAIASCTRDTIFHQSLDHCGMPSSVKSS